VDGEAGPGKRQVTDDGPRRQREAGGVPDRLRDGRCRRGFPAAADEVDNAGNDRDKAEHQHHAHGDHGDLEQPQMAVAENDRHLFGRFGWVVAHSCPCRSARSDAMTAPDFQPEGTWHEIEIAEAEAGQRLDRVLGGRINELSRARLQGLIKEGRVTRDGRTIEEPGHRVKPGERYIVEVPPPQAAEPRAEIIDLAIVHEDADLIVVDKPAGLVVHPAPGHAGGTLVNALIAHCGDSLSGIGGVRRPGIVHRLDKDTSGLLVVAKSDAAHRGLAEQFAAHGSDGRLWRRYLALVWGMPVRPRGAIDASIARSRHNRTRMAVSQGPTARHAVTHYAVLEIFRDGEGVPLASLLELELETGRTHQIRVHLVEIGHPVMGDPVYGSGFASSARRLDEIAQAALKNLGRQALHAAGLGFVHPVTRRKLGFESPLPADFARLLDALRGTAGITAKAAKRPGASKKPARKRPSE
jgi:23S rRNA pseudouridine1911/1915/1917 synthase